MSVVMEFKGDKRQAQCRVFIGEFDLDIIKAGSVEEAIGKAIVKYLGLVNDDGITPVFYVED